MELLQPFFSFFIPLLIIMDPFGNLLFFLLFTEGNTLKERRKISGVALLAAGLILIVFALSGDVILQFFHISVPAFQLAGGFIFFLYSLQMLRLFPTGIKATDEESQEGQSKENVALVPLATPLIAGPGAITAVIVYQQGITEPASQGMLLLGIGMACLTTMLIFNFATRIHALLGLSGIQVITRLMGLLLAVIAVQFMVDGFSQIR